MQLGILCTHPILLKRLSRESALTANNSMSVSFKSGSSLEKRDVGILSYYGSFLGTGNDAIPQAPFSELAVFSDE